MPDAKTFEKQAISGEGSGNWVRWGAFVSRTDDAVRDARVFYEALMARKLGKKNREELGQVLVMYALGEIPASAALQLLTEDLYSEQSQTLIKRAQSWAEGL